MNENPTFSSSLDHWTGFFAIDSGNIVSKVIVIRRGSEVPPTLNYGGIGCDLVTHNAYRRWAAYRAPWVDDIRTLVQLVQGVDDGDA